MMNVLVTNFINRNWSNYDKDNSGTLDIEESRKFCMDLCEKIPGTIFNNKDFESLFKFFDTDNSGTLEKMEVANLLKRLLKLEPAPEPSPAPSKGKKGKKGKKSKGKGKKKKKKKA